MTITANFFPEISWKSSQFTDEFLSKQRSNFIKTIERPEVGFFQLPNRQDLVVEIKRISQEFSDRTQFVHVGIGGSALGPEMLLGALKSIDCLTDFYFINNIDPDEIQDVLSQLHSDKVLFFIVSKSGGTAETLATFSLLVHWLQEKGVTTNDLKNYFVFATDPEKGDLRAFALQYQIECLDIPSNIGGRFSVLSPVGLFPAYFAGIEIEEILHGAQSFGDNIFQDDFKENLLFTITSFLNQLKVEKNINQTVLIPYSSKMKNFSSWFVQLWAESLGKKYDHNGQEVYQGLTPIAAVGATDQHSQMQLFMEGPKDKCLIFIEVDKFDHNFSLSSQYHFPSLAKLSPYSLQELMQAEIRGTLKALKMADRPYIHLRIPRLNECALGALILLFESATVLMGQYLSINPFDQPGVEAGKRYSFEWLEKSGKDVLID